MTKDGRSYSEIDPEESDRISNIPMQSNKTFAKDHWIPAFALLDLMEDEFVYLKRKDEETFFDGKEVLEDAKKARPKKRRILSKNGKSLRTNWQTKR